MANDLAALGMIELEIGELVARDIAMTSKLLQLVNSAFFGLPRHIHHPVQAVSLIGMERLRALVLSLQLFSQFETGQGVREPRHYLLVLGGRR